MTKRDKALVDHALTLLIEMESEFITPAEKRRASELRTLLRADLLVLGRVA